MLSYSPSSSTAWGSVFYVNERMAGGWFILALFQKLKLFPGRLEVIGTIIIPGMIMTLLLALSLLDNVLPDRWTQVLACSFVFALIGGAGYLTCAALREDAGDRQFLAARRLADRARDRALGVSLVSAGR